MKRYKVFMTQPAANDLQGISDYISNELREPAIAKKFILHRPSGWWSYLWGLFVAFRKTSLQKATNKGERV
ncbi:MAG: hypothetical protein M1511_09875 [Deltaproteobacteria bacterium]|nr:hypothetical protein [Deltaproteobacteria bacterium]